MLDGSDRSPETTEDIYLHRSDFEGTALETGMEVSFEVVPDERRSTDRDTPCLRAMNARGYAELVPARGPAIPGFDVVRAATGGALAHVKALGLVGAADQKYYDRLAGKDIDPEAVAIAAGQGGLDPLHGDDQRGMIPETEEQLAAMLEQYLYTEFHLELMHIEGFSFAVVDGPEGDNEEAMDALVAAEIEDQREFEIGRAHV